MRGWRKLKPGDRVESVAGMRGTVVRVSIARRGQSRGLSWVRVRWDNGHEGRVSPPSIRGRVTD